ncbi:MAG TPA: ABC transporter substrate-binding protein [Methylomirabilota bacterium]|jgi:peptide/nickel transport system substrate-binding protein|nr:ABC transporter substrate-binding protein [Methylomirabilota bacterium]
MSLTRRDFIQMGGAAVAAHVLAPAGAAAAETPQRGGVFRIRGEDATTGFDPHLAPNHHRIATNLSFTHSRLVKVKAGPSVVPGTLPVESDLAESWSQPNDRTYVFKLRKGVRWHPKPPVNGRELTADDVKYTYDRFLQIKGNPNRSMLGHVEKIDVLDRHTVKFTLSEPFGWFLDYLANTVMWIVPREAVEQFGDLRRAEACIGTGPWMLERYEPNTRLTFVRHKDYFVPGLPYADGVEVTVDEDPSSRLASWIAGKYDFAPEYGQCVRRLDLPVARQRRPGLRTQDFIVLFGAYTAMKLDREPFRDVRIRRALGMADDWKQILETNAWSLGHGVPNATIPAALKEWAIPIDQLTPTGRRLYERDVSEAKRLLSEAGFPQGFKTTVEATLAWSPDYVDALQVTMRGWKDAGIDAELKSKDFGAYMATTIYGKFDKLGHGLRGGSPIADISLYNSHIPGEPLNASGVDDPKLTEMIRVQRRTLDVAKRREIVYDIQRYLAEQVYYAFGPSVSAVAAWEPRVKNWAPNIGQDYGGRLMGAWLSK